jgi:hypothetical protein
MIIAWLFAALFLGPIAAIIAGELLVWSVRRVYRLVAREEPTDRLAPARLLQRRLER